jgi:PHD/YefM family antitoxin component YafN of YafNO toxin-antitoxin module
MVTYATDELIPSSEFAKKFGSYLSQIKESTIDKIAVLKNNKVEAVLVSKDDYERMSEALELLEHQEIYKIVQERSSKPYKTISMEDMAKSLDIDLDKLD